MELFVKPPSVSPGVTPRCHTEHTHTLALLLKPCDATRGFQRPELTFLLLISKTNGNRDSPVVRVVSSTSSSPLSQRLLLNYGPWFVFFFFFHTVLLLLVVVSLSLSIVEALCDLPFSYRLEKTIYPTRLPFTHNTSLTQYPSSCKPRPGRHMNWSSRIYQSEPALILLMRPLYSPPTTLPPSLPTKDDRLLFRSPSSDWASLCFLFIPPRMRPLCLRWSVWRLDICTPRIHGPQRLLENKDGGIKSGMRKACRWSMFHRQLGVLSSRFCPRLL